LERRTTVEESRGVFETKEAALSKRVEMRISKEGLADSSDDLSEGDEGRITLVSGI